jgi:hypothetical protein
MKTNRLLSWNVFFILSICCTLGCTTKKTASGERVFFKNTAAYNRKLAKLKLNEHQARINYEEYLSTNKIRIPPAGIFDNYHAVIVGDCFVFSFPRKANVDLSGYYVDGHTGKVSERDEGRVNPPFLAK